MSWWVSIETEQEILVHNCPNCGGHEGGMGEVFSVNITYNVGTMLRNAGLHPAIFDGTTVKDALPLWAGSYQLMRRNRAFFSQFDSPADPLTGEIWGTYDTTISAVEAMNDALSAADPDNKVRWI